VLCHATAEATRLLAELDAPMAQAARDLLAPLGRARTLSLIGRLDEIRAAASSTRQPSKLARTRSSPKE
jgi:hypothetical protein